MPNPNMMLTITNHTLKSLWKLPEAVKLVPALQTASGIYSGTSRGCGCNGGVMTTKEFSDAANLAKQSIARLDPASLDRIRALLGKPTHMLFIVFNDESGNRNKVKV